MSAVKKRKAATLAQHKKMRSRQKSIHHVNTKKSILEGINYEQFYGSHLEHFRLNGSGQAQALCPFHDDEKPSFSVNLTDRSKQGAWRCFGCGKRGDVFAFAGEIYGTNGDFPKTLKQLVQEVGAGKRPKRVVAKRRRKTGLTYPSIEAAAKWLARTKGGKVAGRWKYSSSFWVVRVNTAEGKTFMPFHRVKGAWRWGDPPGKLPLYRAGGLPADGPVFVVEGEKCARVVVKMGLAAVTSAHGSQSPGKSDWTPLAGRDVVVLPDNDKPGEGYAQAVGAILTDLDPPASVRILTLPDLPDGGDVADWAAALDDTKEELGEALVDMAEKARPWVPSAPEASTGLHLTEKGNAERFVEAWGEGFRWCEPWGRWLAWDGRRWGDDDCLAVRRAAMKLSKLVDKDVAAEEDDGRRTSCRKWASACERAAVVRASLELARALLAVVPETFDADPWLLNVCNGTVDLRTGKLKPHDKADLITKLAPVDYDEQARCPRWKRFLREVFNDDPDLISYVRRLAGLFLTADVSEHIFPIFWGSGRNGKSVLIDTLLGMLGEYACKAPPSLLTVRAHQEHPTEIADLQGRRFVIGTETEQGARLRIQLVKEMTGDATLKGRFMRQDYFEFQRTFKLALVTNHKPRILDDSEAAWERVRLVPFKVQFLEGTERPPDKHLLKKLKAEWPGILAWAVRGCLAWQKDGELQAPKIVRAATAEYRSDEDRIKTLVDEVAVLEPKAWTPVFKLRAAFEDAGELKWGRAITDRLKALGCKAKSRKVQGKLLRGWSGIKLQP